MLEGVSNFLPKYCAFYKPDVYSGNAVLNLDGNAQIKFLHIIVVATIFSEVIKKACENKLVYRSPISICWFLCILRTRFCLRNRNYL